MITVFVQELRQLEASLKSASGIIFGLIFLIFILLGTLFRNLNELKAAQTQNASVPTASVPVEKTVPADSSLRGLFCAEGTFLAGVSSEGKAVCRAASGDGKSLTFVGGFMGQEECKYDGETLDKNCRLAARTIQACKEDIRPFVIRSGKLDYLLPTLCFERNQRCYVEAVEGSGKKRTYFACENYFVRGRAYATKK